jgi:hypothetical protein
MMDFIIVLESEKFKSELSSNDVTPKVLEILLIDDVLSI